jgi:hypothetical protein
MSPVARFVTSTDAAGRAASVASVTRPEIVPVACAKAIDGKTSASTANAYAGDVPSAVEIQRRLT